MAGSNVRTSEAWVYLTEGRELMLVYNGLRVVSHQQVSRLLQVGKSECMTYLLVEMIKVSVEAMSSFVSVFI